MRVKELLSQLKFEDPESEVLPCSDDTGNVCVTIMPREECLDQSLISNEEAATLLAGHVERIEKIRTALGAFYGLPVTHKLQTSEWNDWVELAVKSPTGKTMVIAEITVKYVVRKDDFGWRREDVGNDHSNRALRFKDTTPDLAGYGFNIHKYVLTRDKLNEAMKELCESPKWLEVESERGR